MECDVPIPGLNPLLDSLPAKFETLRPSQVTAVMDILERFETSDVVVLDAPTGSGKTIIAEVVRLMLRARSNYICHNKDLQAQFAGDFPYARVVQGRANYDSQTPGITCDNCTRTVDEPCRYCAKFSECPYQLAKVAAVSAPVACLNSAYWLLEVQSQRSMFADRGLTVIDEADTFESVLMGQVSVTISPRQQQKWGIAPPERMGSDHEKWAEISLSRLVSLVRMLEGSDSASDRERRALTGLVSRLHAMVEDCSRGSAWVYTGGAGSTRRSGEVIEFKPVTVTSYGQKQIWSRDHKFLVMSGSVIHPQMLAEDELGYAGTVGYVQMPSSFPAENRPVIVRPVADMSRKGRDEGLGRLCATVQEILDRHPSPVRAVLHSVSYDLARNLSRSLRRDRPIHTYGLASDRASAISQLRGGPGSVLVAPSADRGLDLPDDLCRLQIIAKVPFPYLGDKQVAARLYGTKNGKLWYNVQVARTVMQMVGRGVRHDQDWCETYILDSGFVRWYGQWQNLFPEWFREAIRFERG